MAAASISISQVVDDHTCLEEGNANILIPDIPIFGTIKSGHPSHPLPSSDTRPIPTTSTTLQPPLVQSVLSSAQAVSHQTPFSHPKSPTPSSQSRHIGFLSWMSGHGSSTSGQDTSKNSSVNFCRICHEGESGGERLISPCRCSGSVGLIHRSCIEKWLTTVNHDTCELCKQKYSISRHPRPFSSWLCEPAVGDDQRNLVGDGVCFLLLTPLAGISAYLCASGAVFYFQDKQSEAIGLICLSSLLVIIYLAWLVLTIRYHCQVWFKWRSNNQDIRLLNVSGQRPSAVRRRVDQRQVEVLVRPSIEVFENVEIVVTRAISQSSVSSLSSQQSGHKSPPDQHPSGHNISHLAQTDQSVPVLVLAIDDEASETVVPKDDATKPSNLFPPLSPHITSHDPQYQSNSKVVHFTADSEIYAQLPATSCPAAEREDFLTNSPPSLTQTCTNATQFQDHQLSVHTRAVSVPYLPDLKEHFIALRSRQDPVNMSHKSRGTFSPNIRPGNVAFSSKLDKPIDTSFGQTIQALPSSEGIYKSRPLPPLPRSPC